MADPISEFGRKPGMPDTGYGEMLPGVTYASIMGTISKHARIVRLGGRMGRNYTLNGLATLAAYDTASAKPDDRLAQTAQFTVSNVMTHHGQGTDLVHAVQAYAKVNAGTEIALSISAGSGGGSMAYGMGEWGHVLHEENQGTPPTQFVSINSRPEGKMSLWAEIIYNRPPAKPAVVSPTPNSMIVTLKPTLTCTFDDPDITLDHMGSAVCDRLTKYQFEIWTATASGAKSSRIYNTGVLNANSTQQSQKKASFTPANNLSAGNYIATCTFWDEFGEPSPRQEWAFTVVSGGAIEGMDLDPAHYIQPGLTDDTHVYARGTWESQGGASTATMRMTVRRSSGTIVSGPIEKPRVVAPGALIGDWTSYFGHPALTPGLSYYIELEVTDSTGQVSPVARTPDFRVKGIPPVPTLKSPAHGAGFVSPPTLVGTMGEDDGSTVVNPEFGLRTSGSSTWTTIDLSRLYYEDGDYYLALGTSDLPTKTTWEWSIRAVDAFGDASAWATPREFVYADPPTVTITGITEGSTIATSKPTVTINSSSSFTTYWYTIFNTTTQKTVYTSNRLTLAQPASSHTFEIADNLRNTHGYLITFSVETAAGISGSKTVSFDVDYPAPTSVASVQTEVVPGPMESVNEPRWWSRIRVTWSEVPSAAQPDEVFYGYVLERRSLSTDEVDMRRVFRSRSQTEFLDVTPRSGEQYEYTVYWIRKPDAVNYVASYGVTVQNGVELKGATLSSLSDPNLGAPIYAFSERRPEWGSAKAVTVHETWGELPIAFQSLNRGDVIAGTFVPMDDPYGQYTHMDIVNAVRKMSRPEISSTGVPTPQAVYYRDGRGRAGAFVISGPSGESDRNWINAIELNLTLTEVRVSMVEVGP